MLINSFSSFMKKNMYRVLLISKPIVISKAFFIWYSWVHRTPLLSTQLHSFVLRYQKHTVVWAEPKCTFWMLYLIPSLPDVYKSMAESSSQERHLFQPCLLRFALSSCLYNHSRNHWAPKEAREVRRCWQKDMPVHVISWDLLKYWTWLGGSV